MQHFTNCSIAEMYHLLKKVWGYSEFRHPQLDIIQHIMFKGSCLAIMPTGSGKSLCYQFLSLISTHCILVVSPLIALMEDQVIQANKLGIAASSVHSNMEADEMKTVYHELRERQIKLLFVSPERLQVPSFISLIQDTNLSLLVIDEAHCISQWGHDFRPAYQRINSFIKQVVELKILALTATASLHVQKDIQQQLKIHKGSVFKASLYRKNLSLRFVYSVSKRDYLAKHIPHNHRSIIYIQHRKRAEQIADYLVHHGHRAVVYHAGMDKQDRQDNQELWMKGSVNCMVATSAFGMGINQAEVRTVYHYLLPNSMEDYYQEIGRAGRDGKPAACITLYTNKDMTLIKRQIQKMPGLTASKQLRSKKRSARSMLGLLLRKMCRFKYVLDYFEEELTKDCGRCDYCLERELASDETNLVELKSFMHKQPLQSIINSYPKKEQHALIKMLNNLIEEDKMMLKDAYLEWIKKTDYQ